MGLGARTKQDKLTDAFARWQAEKTPETEAALHASLEPVISTAVHSFGGGDPALKIRAKILAGNAINTYDPKAGASLSTHVYNNLQRLNRYRAARSRVLHIPENVRMDSAAIHRFVTDYTDKHGVEPSDSAISDGTGLSLKRIARTRTGNEMSGSQAETDKGDVSMFSQRNAEQIWADYVYHDSDERSRKILEWSTGYNGQPILPKHEIAKRLRITPAAVSLRISKMMSKMQEGLST